MPKDFLDCIKRGGKVITKKLSNGKYIRICMDRLTKKTYAGEVKKAKKK